MFECLGVILHEAGTSHGHIIYVIQKINYIWGNGGCQDVPGVIEIEFP